MCEIWTLEYVKQAEWGALLLRTLYWNIEPSIKPTRTVLGTFFPITICVCHLFSCYLTFIIWTTLLFRFQQRDPLVFVQLEVCVFFYCCPIRSLDGKRNTLNTVFRFASLRKPKRAQHYTITHRCAVYFLKRLVRLLTFRRYNELFFFSRNLR